MFPSSITTIPSTRFYAQGNLFVAKHSSNAEYVRPSYSKAAREERGLPPVPMNPEGERPRATKERSRKMKSKINAMFNGVDLRLLNPANAKSVMLTLKYSGSNKRRFELAPNDGVVNDHIVHFETYMSEQTGSPIKWMWFKDTNIKPQGVHIHGLMFPQGPMKDETRLSLSPEQIIHEGWAIASGQFDKEDDFDPERLSSPISHIRYGTDFADTAAAVSAFALYEGHKKDEETGKWKPKVAQKKTDALWLATGNYRVQWAGISAAVTPAILDLDVEIKCDCGVADAYAAAQKFSAAERKFIGFPSRVSAGEVVQLDTARFSMDFLKRGGMEFGMVIPELITSIKSIAEAHADCSTFVPAEALPASPDTASTTQDSTMTDNNEESNTTFPANDLAAIEQVEREGSLLERYPVITVEQHHAQPEVITADQAMTYSESQHPLAITFDLLDSKTNRVVTADEPSGAQKDAAL